MRAAWTGMLSAVALVVPIGARASDPPAAVAERLFREGRALLLAGKVAEACDKLTQSLNLDGAATGTLLNLAFCNERSGKLATALTQFREVAARSRGARPDRVQIAEESAAQISARLSHLRIDVPAELRDEGLVVTLDGAPVDASSFGTNLPVDGGDHTIARSGQTWTIHVAAERDLQVFVVPAPAPVAAPEPPPPPPPAPAPSPAREPTQTREPAAPQTSGARTTGLVIGVAGLTTLAVGSAFGIAALAAKKPTDLCGAGCGADDKARADAAFVRVNAYAWVADVAIPVGAVAAIVGAYLFFANEPARRTPGVAGIALGANGVRVDGTF